jgi:glutamate synthase (NADPH/NADH) large chain
MTGGLALVLGGTGRNIGAGMSGGTAYVIDLDRDRINTDALASGELELHPLGSADVEIVLDLLRRHLAETGSTVAERLLAEPETSMHRFTKILPRDYAAVLATRQTAVDEGLDPDGDVAWKRILEVTGG